MRSGFLEARSIMRQHKAFEIAFVGLKNGIHHFTWQIDDVFFASFSPPDFQDSDLTVQMDMDKKENFFLLDFEITGSIRLNCDRCGDLFEMAIWDKFSMVVKRVSNPSEMENTDDDPNVAFISLHESILNVAKWIYEFALLSIPMQRIHPNDENGKSTCNPAVLKKLDKMKKNRDTNDNPIWKGLEQFRNK